MTAHRQAGEDHGPHVERRQAHFDAGDRFVYESPMGPLFTTRMEAEPRRSEAPASLGVLGMRERAASLDGQLTIVSSAGKGTSVRLELPLNKGQQRFTPAKAHA